MMLSIVVPAVSVLAGRLSRIRRRLGQQKQELTVALEQIKLMAAHDDLTGLLNRRHMQVLLEQETQRSLRSGRGFCVALLDMDHFKRVNDRMAMPRVMPYCAPFPIARRRSCAARTYWRAGVVKSSS
jgi:PleD family two-component response regulator